VRCAQNGSLPVVFGHCVIVPMSHAVCTRDLDEDALNEITKFKLALEAMFHSMVASAFADFPLQNAKLNVSWFCRRAKAWCSWRLP
jgi:hypothetical protein